jgi:class 3 adenylate cyclase/tetratricopeptide (TPR) repeat protein
MSTGQRSGTLSVLFTDLVGSTELMARLGEATFDTLRREHFARLREAIAGHAGEEVKSTGDGLIAVFGSAVEAVRCAVAMQQATDWQSRSGPGRLSLRVALSLGEVTLEDGDIYGSPVVEAARLVSLAQGRQILATALIRAVAGTRADVRFEDVGPLELRGLPEPVPSCEVLWEPLGAEIPLPALLAGDGQFFFVGRDAELTRLRTLWKESEAGQRRVVLIAGEPGVGKTRLAAEVARAAHAGDAVVLAGRCDEGLGVPYQPFVEALRHFVTHAARWDLSARLGRLAGELTRLVPEISETLSGLPPPIRSDPETERYRLFDAVAAWLGSLSKGAPGLLVLDDLQWAARPTLLLLRHVVRSPEPMRLLILGTYRDTELARDHPLAELLADLRRDVSVDRLALSGLDTQGVAALVAGVTAHELGEEDFELARAIHAETQGNPFFVGEVLNHLSETGAVDRLERRWTRRLPIEELGIPEGVREVVGRRLSRLSESANRVLSLAAVAGEEFELAVLEAAGDFENETLVAALEEAVRARLVNEAAGPAPRHRFAHALVRATLYDELSPARRAALHGRIGEAIQTVHPRHLDDHLPALARHFALATAGGDTSTAVHWTARAGDQALALLAHDEAVAYYGQALELLDASEGPTDDGLRCDLLISLGEAQRRAGDRAHRETLLDAAQVARRLGDAHRLTRAALANHRGFFSAANEVDDERVEVLEAALEALEPDDSAFRARLLVTLAAELVFSPEHQRRHRLVTDGLSMGRRVGDPTTLGDVLARGYIPMFTSLDIAALREHTAELGRLAEELDDPALGFWASTWGFMTSVLVADLAAAAPLIASSTRVAGDLGQPFMLWTATFGRSHLSRIHGRLEEAEALSLAAFELARAAGLPDAFRMFGIQLFWIRFDQGRLEEVVDLFGKALSRQRVPPLTLAAYCLALCELGRRDEARPLFDELAGGGFAIPFAWIFGATMLAEVAAALGDDDHGAILYDRLLPHHALLATNGATTTGPVAHYLGLLAAALGRHTEAEAHFAEALGLEERIGAPAWLARTRLECAQWLLARGRPGDAEGARDLLARSLTGARELGLRAVERRAEGVLDSMVPRSS